ncbi:MAG: class I SAM-dependent methyltransferase [Chloroflexi bacterium]|nr:class I SAM-dependent methyltransferase [Chloroflexota bacterium]
MTDLTVGDATPVIDYEGSGYRKDFWEGRGREYEDAVERAALAQLLPQRGRRIAEIGAGFGRLADLYLGYEQIVLFDYSTTLLQEAVSRWGDDPRFVFVTGNIYELPLADGVLDTLVMVRVMHHLADVPQALAQLRRVLHSKSVAVLEYANKRNLKAMVRWLLGRQEWSPFAAEPVEFVRLNYDFHPGWMTERMGEAQLRIARQFAVSHFRLPILKERVAAARLVGIEQPFFALGGRFPLAPSVFVQAAAPSNGQSQAPSTQAEDVPLLLRCPHCSTSPLQWDGESVVVCPSCSRRYARRESIWNMKEAV